MPGHREKEPFYIAKVVNIDDPEHRKRIQCRGPYETEEDIPDDCLLWFNALPTPVNGGNFSLPDVGDPVMIMKYGSMNFWSEMPDKESWQDFGDDYQTAYLKKHKDVLLEQYKASEGWLKQLTGNIKIETDDVTIDIQGQNVKLAVGNVTVTTDGTAVKIVADKAEISTDGDKITIKNNGVSLADAIDALEQALIAHTHPTPAGPSSAPINVADFNTNKSKFKQLLK